MSRAYLFHLSPDNILASMNGQLFLACGLEQVWETILEIDHRKIQVKIRYFNIFTGCAAEAH